MIETDASTVGVGVVLQKANYIIAYISKALSSQKHGLYIY